MRKVILLTVAIVTLFSLTPTRATLWDYYQEQGLPFPSVEHRAPDYAQIASDKYEGSYEQNILLEDVLRGQGFILGGTRQTSPLAGATYTLSGAGLSSSATSITLQKFTIPQTGHEIVTADLSDIFYITLEPGNNKRQEIVSCTTVAQAGGDTTATLSGCVRGLTPFYPFTASTTYRFSHAGGTSVILSDPPQLFEQYTSKNSTSTVSAIWKFSVFPEFDSAVTPTTALQFATKQYVDNGLNQGASTSTESTGGISELATQLEMASSTDLGVNIPLVLQAKYATSSPYGHSNIGNFAVIGNHNGYIAQDWLNLTEDYLWTGLHTFNATTTMSTTTIDEVTITSSTITTQLTLEGVDAGQLVDGSDVPSTVHTHSNLAGFVSSTSQTVTHAAVSTVTVVSESIPANTLGTDKCIFVKIYITDLDVNGAADSDVLVIDLNYGATTVANVNIDVDTTITDYTGYILGELCGDGTTGKQFASLEVVVDELDAINGALNKMAREARFGTATEDSTGALTFAITSQWVTFDGSVTYRNAYITKAVE